MGPRKLWNEPLRHLLQGLNFICAFLLSTLYFTSIGSRSVIITAAVTRPIDLRLSIDFV